jgi:hypothetical protein
MSIIISFRDHQCEPKDIFLYKCKIRRNMWANVRAHDEQQYIFGIDFWPYNRKKMKPTKFANSFVFYEFSGFATKIVRPISAQRNDIDGWFFSPQIQLFNLYKIGYLLGDSETLVVFSGETPWNRSTRIITFFAIIQEAVDQSISSSNSTEISIRRFYAQNFITIRLAFEE